MDVQWCIRVDRAICPLPQMRVDLNRAYTRPHRSSVSHSEPDQRCTWCISVVTPLSALHDTLQSNQFLFLPPLCFYVSLFLVWDHGVLPNVKKFCFSFLFSQTLKVEPYHDSFLAQYLIKRALGVSCGYSILPCLIVVYYILGMRTKFECMLDLRNPSCDLAHTLAIMFLK